MKKSAFFTVLSISLLVVILLWGVVCKGGRTENDNAPEDVGTIALTDNGGELDQSDGAIEERVDDMLEGYGVPHPRDYVFPGLVLDVSEASGSELAPTITQVWDDLDSRGFEEVDPSYGYSMEGDLLYDDSYEDDALPHPTYSGYYEAENGTIWLLEVVNGQLMALRIDLDAVGAPSVVSEQTYITVYNSYTNQFIRGVPDGTAMELTTVERLDASTLDGLSVGA